MPGAAAYPIVLSAVRASEAQRKAAEDNFAVHRAFGEQSLARFRRSVCEYCKSPHTRQCCPNCGGPAPGV